MKKLLLLSAALFCFSFVNAQDDMGGSPTDAGTIFLNGSSDLNIEFRDGTPIDLFVKGGYFFADKILGGASVNFSSFDGNSNTDFGLFARYYVTDALFLGVGAAFEDDTNVQAELGYNIFLSDKVALEPTFVYPFQDGADPSIGMGISVFL